MSITQATGTFKQKSWDEKPYSEIEGQATLARASVVNDYHGDIEGEGSVEYLMTYASKEMSYFVGYERITGKIGERAGSFILQQVGSYDATIEGGLAKASWSVVPGSGTGDLRGLRGEGSYEAYHAKPVQFTLNYEFE